MDNLKTLSDQSIHQHMLETSKKERELTLLMISLVEEADRRKFYLDLGFATLYDYMTLGLKYSGGAAMRRISSARLTKEIPKIKEQILDGTLSLTNVSQAEQFIRNEAKHDHVMSIEEKKEVLKLIAGKSVRQAESTLIEISAAPEQTHLKDKVKVVSPTLTQITFSASPEFMIQLEEAKGLLAHRLLNATVSEVLAEIMKFGLDGLRKQKFKVKKREQESFVSEENKRETENEKESFASEENKREQESFASEENKRENENENENENESFVSEENKREQESITSEENSTSSAGNASSDYIRAVVQRAVFHRDQGRCVVINPLTGEKCGSQLKLELDHYPIPRAMNGPSTVGNLRLACKKCNLLHAVHVYGREKIVEKMSGGRE